MSIIIATISILFAWVPSWSFFTPARPSLRPPAWWARSPISTCCWSTVWVSMERKVSQTNTGQQINKWARNSMWLCTMYHAIRIMYHETIIEQFGFAAIVKFHLISNTLKTINIYFHTPNTPSSKVMTAVTGNSKWSNRHHFIWINWHWISCVNGIPFISFTNHYHAIPADRALAINGFKPLSTTSTTTTTTDQQQAI